MKYLNSNSFLIYFTLFVLIFFGNDVFAERLAVSVPKANIRSGPGTKYDILWEVEKYHPLEVIEKKGIWYRFKDFEGDKGWIHQSIVTDIPTVITKKQECNVRTGPGTNYSVEFIAQRGVALKVLNQKGEWIHVQHADGDKGWIHESLVW